MTQVFLSFVTQMYRNPRLLSLSLLIVLMLGFSALTTLPRMEDPYIRNRVAIVVTQFPGATPERVEALVSEPLEQEIRTLSEVKLVEAVSRTGVSVLRVELHDSILDVDPIWSRVRDKIDVVAPTLPDQAGAPRLDEERGYAFTRIFALKWDASESADYVILSRFAKELEQVLQNQSGTEYVQVYGEAAEEVVVEVDLDRLRDSNLSLDQLLRRVRQADAKRSGGVLDTGTTRSSVEVGGEFLEVERIAAIPLREGVGNEQGLRLRDIASVTVGERAPPRELAIHDGERVVVLAARIEPSRRVDIWAESNDALIAAFKQSLPRGVSLEFLFDQTRYTSDRLQSLSRSLAIGAVLVVGCLYLTLGLRSALIVGFFLPLMSLLSLFFLKLVGYQIHQMTVTGIIVALGIMVDNCIVMTDYMRSRLAAGSTREQAIGSSIRHLSIPLLGSTVTTVLAFMPIVLLPGPSGEFVSGIAVSVICSLISSYILSFTILPAVLAMVLPAAGGSVVGAIKTPKLAAFLKRVISFSLRSPLRAIAIAWCLPLVGFVAGSTLDEQFFPPSDRDQFQVELVLGGDASISETHRTVMEAYEFLRSKQGIVDQAWFLGVSAPSFYYNLRQSQDGAANYAQAMVTTDSIDSANELVPVLQSELQDHLPGAQVLVRRLEQGPPFDAPLEVRVYGDDVEVLNQLGEELRERMGEVASVIQTRSTFFTSSSKYVFEADEESVALSGQSLSEVATQFESALEGFSAGSLMEGTEELPVRLKARSSTRSSLEALVGRGLSLRGSEQGEISRIPLGALGDLQFVPQTAEIRRRNGKRVNTVQAFLRDGVLPHEALQELQEILEKRPISLPTGYTLEQGGESAERNQAVGNLLASIGILIAMMLLTIVLSFNSFHLAFVILLIAVQSIGLALLSLFILQAPLGFVVINAIMGLVGLAINSGIIIISEVQSLSEREQGDAEKVGEKVFFCSRHITSTTLTTFFGFMPLFLAEGGFWPPFATAMAGGALLATIISFVFVPAAYLLASRSRSRFHMRYRSKVGGDRSPSKA